MRDVRHVLARLQAFGSKFEWLLASARKRAVRPGVPPGLITKRLRELTGFGANPGNLRLFAYVPEHLPPDRPLVVALHGCTQTAEDYDHGTGWSSLADTHGFIVIYPQQQPSNNPKNCFSWFLPGDITRGQGEAFSIREMVEYAIETFAADRRNVFWGPHYLASLLNVEASRVFQKENQISSGRWRMCGIPAVSAMWRVNNKMNAVSGTL